MKRSYVICHILSSLDGKINGRLWEPSLSAGSRRNTGDFGQTARQMPGCTEQPPQKSSRIFGNRCPEKTSGLRQRIGFPVCADSVPDTGQGSGIRASEGGETGC